MTAPQSPAPDQPEGESPYQMLGRAIAAACSDPGRPTRELHALVVYVVEDARLEGLTFLDLVRALDGWLVLHTQGFDERIRWRIASLVRHWALAEFVACEARSIEEAVLGAPVASTAAPGTGERAWAPGRQR